jgi:hypothetical protein
MIEHRLPEFRERAPIGYAEGGAEMTVARKAEIEAEPGEVIIV